MGKAAPNAFFDAAFERVANLGDTIYVCSGEPADFAAIAAVTLASDSMVEGEGNADYTIADAAGGGRKMTMTAQTAVAISATGTATHIALADAAGNELLYVTTCDSQSLTSGGPTVTIPEWVMSIGDPT